MAKKPQSIDWTLATWDGAKREALRRWAALPLERIVAALEEMQELGDALQTSDAVGVVHERKSGYARLTAADKAIGWIGNMSFSEVFRNLTEHDPFKWQKRLYSKFINNNLPSSLDLPTGLGKTSVMAIWLLARAVNSGLPRRLVYIVDRRAVVDQATREAERLRDALAQDELQVVREQLGLAGSDLPISTLRGRHIDNRQWLSNPTMPAIIIGTIDMIGSRLLFEGYGVSRGMRPFHAGLLGVDTLFVLDEAHLCPPFEALLESIRRDRETYETEKMDFGLIPPFRFLPLSATGRVNGKGAFTLQSEDYSDDRVSKRLKAEKILIIQEPDSEEELVDRLADTAWSGRAESSRILVYCNSRKTAQDVHSRLETQIRKEKTHDKIELMVGARRVHEREKLTGWLEETGFLSGLEVERSTPVFLIATSAGEVGVDLDADHMVCDLVPFERMVQRFGRVNRRGDGKATISVLAYPPKKGEKNKPKCPEEAVDLVEPEAPVKPEKGSDKTIRDEYKQKNKSYKDELKEYKKWKKELEKYQAELKKYEIDWDDYHTFQCRKNLLEKLEGDASPGAIVALKNRASEDQPLKSSIDRASTPEPLRPALTHALIDAWSMTSLIEHTGRPDIAPWLRGWISEKPQSTIAWRRYLPWNEEDRWDQKMVEAFFSSAPVHMSEMLETYAHEITDLLIKRAKFVMKSDEKKTKQPALIVLNRAGEMKAAFRMGELADTKDKKKLESTLIGCQLVASSVLGGLSGSGLLDAKHKEQQPTLDDGWSDKELTAIGYRVCAENDLPGSDWRIVYRLPASASEENDDTGDVATIVVAALRQSGATRIGDPAISRNEQKLGEHLDWAGEAAREIGVALGLPDGYVAMLVTAARAHDLGKDREQWQDAMNALRAGRPYAKTRGGGNPRLLNGYRHEFGSLGDVENSGELAALPEALQELALHLIASHHGSARPIIPAIDPNTLPSMLTDRAREAALRFAKLQREWGPWGLAWWEAIFRAADWRASARLDAQNMRRKD